MKRLPFLLVPLLSVWMAAFAHAQSPVPGIINYQAHVTDAAGAAIGAGAPVNRLVHFRFWNNPTATDKPTNLLYSESQTVTINGGDFSVLLGQGAAIVGEAHPAVFADAFNGASVFLGITVDVGNDGISNDSEIAPRQQLVTTAFAFRANIARTVDVGAITEAMLGNGAVTSNKLGAGAVTINNMALGAIKGGNDGDATPANRGAILDGSITSFDLADNSVTRSKIIADAVNSLKIEDGSIGAIDLGAGSVGGSQLQDNSISVAKLVDAVKQALSPPGTIVAYGGTTAPAGWLLCDGASLPRTGTYSTLFAAIGTNFGGIVASEFNVPDLRGRFLRGRDGNMGRDPDRAARTASATGGSIGDNVGSVQLDEFKSHTHGFAGSTGAARADEGSGRNEPQFSNLTTGATGGTETRPKNVYVNYIIKF